MNLAPLLAGIATPTRDTAVSDVTLDSREVRPGSLFLACRGARHHGLDFARSVAERGAAAILWEPDAERLPPELPSDIVVTQVPRLAAQASLIAARFFGLPSEQLSIAGITGTNGKTTTAWLLAQALNRCGRRAAYIGTLGAAFAGLEEAGEFTTPDAVSVQRRLAAFRAQGAECVAMEVSSHALVQDRVAAVRFDAAVLTNLTRDHLDYHGSMDAYAAAKASLFAYQGLRLRVINADDAFGAQLLSLPDFADAVATSSRPAFVPRPGAAYLHAHAVELGARGVAFELASSFGASRIAAPLVGGFNVDNLLAVAAVLLGSGLSMTETVAALAGVTAPPGRLECIGGDGAPLAVVDYAHTPDALEKALTALRAHCTGRLWCVFGCGGDRDRGKRPEMGRIAARLADRVIVTDDNPRSESPAVIVDEIVAGMHGATVQVIHDRGAAIATALGAAAPHDVVLIAGKGHEDYQIVGTERRAFSDQQVARDALRRRGGA